MDILPPLIKFWDIAPKDGWEKAEVIAQWVMALFAVVTAFIAYHAWRAQSAQLNSVIDEQRKADAARRDLVLKNRRATGPHFKIAPDQYGATFQLYVGGTLNKHSYIDADSKGHPDWPEHGGNIYVLLKNIRPSNAMVHWEVSFVEPPKGVGAEPSLLRADNMRTVSETRTEHGEFYILRYLASGEAFREHSRARLLLRFETKDGDIDYQYYDLTIGTAEISRIDPPPFGG